MRSKSSMTMVALAKFAAAYLCLTGYAVAQERIVFDGSTGSLDLSLSDSIAIEQSQGTTRGDKLFHGFERFSIDAGQEVRFLGDETLRAVVLGVSGGQPSEILGTIGIDILGADLWLLNPAGLLVGESATLDVTGSVYLGTGSSVITNQGESWRLGSRPAATLAIGELTDFGFLEADTAEIRLQGFQLPLGIFADFEAHSRDVDVTAGTVISTLGGSIRFTAPEFDAATSTLAISDSRLQVISDGTNLIRLHASAIDLQNAELRNRNVVPTDAGQSIRITGQNVRIAGASQLVSSNQGQARSGDISLAADEISITGSTLVRVDASGIAPAGDILLSGRRIVIGDGEGTDRPRILTEVLDNENAANTIGISADRIDIDKAEISASSLGFGTAGTVALFAVDQVDIKSADISSGGLEDGAAGDIEIGARGTRIRGSKITTESNVATGGRVMVSGSEFVHIDASTITTDGFAPADGASIIDVQGERVAIADSTLRSNFTDQSTAAADSLGALANVSGDAITVIDESTLVEATNAVIIRGIEASLGAKLQRQDAIPIDRRSLLLPGCAGTVSANRSSILYAGASGATFLSPEGQLPSHPARVRARPFGVDVACQRPDAA